MTNMFYEFCQNNSGGYHDLDQSRGIGPIVFIEANSYQEANDKAEEIGIYFNGCEEGLDCDCCGDRWYPKDSYDEAVSREEVCTWKWRESYGPSYVHFTDGSFEVITKIKD